MIVPKKYLLKDGSIYWHELYYALMPKFMTAHSLPGGGYNCAYYLVHPHTYFVELFDNAKWFIQRGYRGYSDRDVWSIDWFLTTILPPMLRQLKKTTHGAPLGVGVKRWDKKLEKMAKTFEIGRRIQDYDKDGRKLYTQFKRELRGDFVEYFFNLWD